jgi:hypothetical protein
VGVRDELERVVFLAKRFDMRGVLDQTEAAASLECCAFALWNSLYHFFMGWRLVLLHWGSWSGRRQESDSSLKRFKADYMLECLFYLTKGFVH